MMMRLLAFAGAILFLLVGHFFKIVRWEKFIRMYEQPPTGALAKSMAIGYALNFLLPYRAGEIVRVIYSGRKLKNGIGFSLATVIIDRFLDVVAVSVILFCFRLAGVSEPNVVESSRFYIGFTFFLLIGLVAVRILAPTFKKTAQVFCGIFNDKLKLAGMKFFWTLINAFRDLWKLNIGAIFINSVLMWFGYMVSYTMLSVCLSADGSYVGVIEVFMMLFSKTSLDISSISIGNILGTAEPARQLLIALYMLLPIVTLYAITALPVDIKKRVKQLAGVGQQNAELQNMLPQLREQDQLQFLNSYFGTKDSEFTKQFIEMNRNISIIKDYSAGSNATTMLCVNESGTFYRKYAFGADGKKLKQQLDWLHAHQAKIPLCSILHEDFTESYCCYDMAYSNQSVGMFRYMHSNPVERSWAILAEVLNRMRKNLYTEHDRKAEADVIQQYIESKVTANLKTIKESSLLKDLLQWDTVVINGKTYRNLRKLEYLFEPDYLQRIFSGDRCSEIHGDLTIENIICIEGIDEAADAFYIIDPNTGNVHDTQFLDYAKLLQSLHGGYEFLMMTNSVVVFGNHIDFMYTKSAIYDDMFKRLKTYLSEQFSTDEVISIFHHELVHWLRLMPYKLRKDKERAAMFYAGLIMVANDIDCWFRKNDRIDGQYEGEKWYEKRAVGTF